MDYLEIKFHDNDFSHCGSLAVQQLWKYIAENNRHMLSGEALTDVFKKLHKAGALESMIRRLWVLEILKTRVEWKTRGLYYDNQPAFSSVKWDEKAITDPIQDTFSDYLTFDIEFHESDTFIEWSNGEHIWLNIETGDSNTF